MVGKRVCQCPWLVALTGVLILAGICRILSACRIENPRAQGRPASRTVWGEGAKGDCRGGVGEGEG